jgi:hypothetical protein
MGAGPFGFWSSFGVVVVRVTWHGRGTWKDVMVRAGVHDGDVWGVLERGSDSERIEAARAHVEVERLGVVLCKPAVVQAGHGAGGGLEEVELHGEGGCCMGRMRAVKAGCRAGGRQPRP